MQASVPWRVKHVQAMPDYRLAVVFLDGTRGTVDLSPLIMSEHAGVFAALREPNAFAGVTIECGAVTWPGKVDLAPDAMYDAIKAGGTWTVR